MRDTSIRESLTQKQWDRIFYSCPGAWAGCMGHVSKMNFKLLTVRSSAGLPSTPLVSSRRDYTNQV